MKTTNADRYNEGLIRGRRAQTERGYLPPTGVYSLPDEERDAYLAGWEMGHSRTTRIDLLKK